MITVEEALKLVADNAINLGTEKISLTAAKNRILAESIYTDRPIPPYNRVTMDGIAINYEGFSSSNSRLPIEGIAPAGHVQQTLTDKQSCIEVMTGAVLPHGTDTVIRYEDLEIVDGVATVSNITITAGKNVHTQGSDIQQGIEILIPGLRLSSAELGIAASVGRDLVAVKTLPRTIILSTGDELIDIDQSPLPHQIRRSNNYTIASLMTNWGIEADMVHLPDDKELIEREMSKILADYDLIILSGGVSKGKFDYIPAAMTALGVETIFHKIKQRPGKPLWFGRRADKIIFGLPGNPVSSFVCARKYVYHWLQKSLGLSKPPTKRGVLSEAVDFKPDLHYFLPVNVHSSDTGMLMVKPYKGNGSGDFVNLKNANAFIELPRGKNHFAEGEVYEVLEF